jgi:cob(I)alamin adenosyltransferase
VGRKRDEPVRLTRIYTRTGDEGETSLGDLTRVRKTDPRVVAYGAVDELNAQLGLVAAADVPPPLRPVLARVQNELFDLGADVSLPAGKEGLRVTQGQVELLEADCDRFNADLPALKSFVLPGGTDVAARLHVARTVCRRAELEALRAPGVNPVVHAYLNRLGDLLFILSRAANAAAGEAEPLWKPGSSQPPS